MRRRSRVAKITRGGGDGDENSLRKSRSDALANDQRDVEDHSLSKYDRVYNYQTKSTTREERVEGRGWALQTHLHLVLDKSQQRGLGCRNVHRK